MVEMALIDHWLFMAPLYNVQRTYSHFCSSGKIGNQTSPRGSCRVCLLVLPITWSRNISKCSQVYNNNIIHTTPKPKPSALAHTRMYNKRYRDRLICALCARSAQSIDMCLFKWHRTAHLCEFQQVYAQSMGTTFDHCCCSTRFGHYSNWGIYGHKKVVLLINCGSIRYWLAN